MCIYIYIYIYIERERERYRSADCRLTMSRTPRPFRKLAAHELTSFGSELLGRCPCLGSRPLRIRSRSSGTHTSAAYYYAKNGCDHPRCACKTRESMYTIVDVLRHSIKVRGRITYSVALFWLVRIKQELTLTTVCLRQGLLTDLRSCSLLPSINTNTYVKLDT